MYLRRTTADGGKWRRSPWRILRVTSCPDSSCSLSTAEADRPMLWRYRRTHAYLRSALGPEPGPLVGRLCRPIGLVGYQL